MDIYLKMVALALLGVLLCMILSKNAKEYCTVIALVLCCGLCIVTVGFLKPIFNLIDRFESLIGKSAPLLSILIKASGLSLLGEIVGSICADTGHSAVGKTIQLSTTIVILYISLPLIQNLLEMIQSILEML